MQTRLTVEFAATPEGQEADAILRSCVHCGFCTATCPTYQLIGDELDGPRGRIYLIKQMLEGEPVTRKTQFHLDRCLTCRACETTCPSGVRYARLLDIGRHAVDVQVPRSWHERIKRRAIRWLFAEPARLRILLAPARLLRPLLPGTLARRIPPTGPAGDWPVPRHARRMLVLDGCVQQAVAADINAAAARVLDRLGISVTRTPGTGCCGALHHHLSAEDAARTAARCNIDAWWTELQAGAEAIVVTASGCATMLRDYGTLLADDPAYAERGRKVAEKVKDIGEILENEDLKPLGTPGAERRIAFHAPCTLQHGLHAADATETVLRKMGFELTPVPDAHLCCGSAGSYSLLHAAISNELRNNKLAALQSGKPELIATANIGCQLHLSAGTSLPVVHWIKLLDAAL